jgi:hypothetical protein
MSKLTRTCKVLHLSKSMCVYACTQEVCVVKRIQTSVYMFEKVIGSVSPNGCTIKISIGKSHSHLLACSFNAYIMKTADGINDLCAICVRT